jgi:hypothetical protein
MNLQRIAKILETKDDLIINEVILTQADKKGQVIYGARAYNYQAPAHLKKKTFDYDILSKKPKKSAQETARALSRRLGKGVSVVRGSHKGTYRIKIGKETIADYTQLKSKPKTKKKFGIEVKSLKSIKRNTQKLLKNKKTEFRREKDLDTFQRIQEIERIEKTLPF